MNLSGRTVFNLLLFMRCLVAEIYAPASAGTLTAQRAAGVALEKRATLQMGKQDGNFNDVGDEKEEETKKKAGSSRILSRRRRYLTFPVGSSFQAAFDMTVPLVPLPLLFNTAITVAIAWPLPTEPLYKLAQDYRKKVTEQIEQDRRDKLKATSKKDKLKGNPKKQKGKGKDKRPTTPLDNISIYKDLLAGLATALKHPNGSSPLMSPNYYHYGAGGGGDKTKTAPLSPFDWKRNDWSALIHRFSEAAKRAGAEGGGAHHPLAPLKKRVRRYFPVFGGRGRRETIYEDADDAFHHGHHRATRQVLYGKINKMLTVRGINGTACVLRALCETGQRDEDHTPGTFLQELMRAIFSMPGALALPTDAEEQHCRKDNSKRALHTEYDRAHSYAGDCSQLYRSCNHSVWSDDFIF